MIRTNFHKSVKMLFSVGMHWKMKRNCIFRNGFSRYPLLLLYPLYARNKCWKSEKFLFPFLIDLHLLGYPKHDLTICRKCLSMYKLVLIRISTLLNRWCFLFHFFQKIWDRKISTSIACNRKKFYTQNAYYTAEHLYNLSVHSSLGGAAIMLFFRNFCDSHLLASVAWKYPKNVVQNTYNKKYYFFELCEPN